MVAHSMKMVSQLYNDYYSLRPSYSCYYVILGLLSFFRICDSHIHLILNTITRKMKGFQWNFHEMLIMRQGTDG